MLVGFAEFILHYCPKEAFERESKSDPERHLLILGREKSQIVEEHDH
jgi:hypothetical protein